MSKSQDDVGCHLMLTVLTCGLWLPVWLAIIFTTPVIPTHCSICGNQFKRTYYKCGSEYLCGHCNQQAERDNSRHHYKRRKRMLDDDDDDDED